MPFGILKIVVNSIEKLLIFLNRREMLLRKLLFDLPVFTGRKMMFLSRKLIRQHFMERSKLLFGFEVFDFPYITIVDLFQDKA